MRSIRFPMERLAPNTMSVATYGKGMVPVNGLSVKSGRDTIQALAELFASLRSEGVSGLCVWSGTLTRTEQAASQAQAALRYAAQMSLEDAVRKTLAQDTPVSVAEQRRDDTVEIRLIAAARRTPILALWMIRSRAAHCSGWRGDRDSSAGNRKEKVRPPSASGTWARRTPQP